MRQRHSNRLSESDWTLAGRSHYAPASRRVRHHVLLVLLMGLGIGPLTPSPVSASEIYVIPQSEAPVLLKVLTYDRVFARPEIGPVNIAVLFAEGDPVSEADRDAVVGSLQEASGQAINGKPFRFLSSAYHSHEALTQLLADEEVHVLYVAQGLDLHLDDITAAARRNAALTMTTVSGFVARGVSVGLIAQGERPRIMLNLPAIKAEGHDLSANFLRLCEVIR